MADTKISIKCPACNEFMEKVFIEKINFNVDVCKNCGGVYFDNREFKHFDESHEDISQIEEVLNSSVQVNVYDNVDRQCASCGATMTKIKHGDIEIDECYTCGAKFLDGGELQKYRSQYKNDEERKVAFNKLLSLAIFTKNNL